MKVVTKHSRNPYSIRLCLYTKCILLKHKKDTFEMRKRVSINLSEKVIMKIRTLHPFKLVEQWREIYFF